MRLGVSLVLTALLGGSFALPAPAPAPEVPEAPPVDAMPPYLTSTYVHYPATGNWWTLGVSNSVKWAWAAPQRTNLRIVLSNPTKEMLNGSDGVIAESVPSNDFSYTTKALTGLQAGKGYVITLQDANSSAIYAASSPFEIKPMGSLPDPPKPFRDSSAGSIVVPGLGLIVAGCAFALL